MICNKCNNEIPDEEEVQYKGKIFCEDCYVEMLEPPRTCDIAAVYSAKMARKMAGQEGTDGLTDLQKDIYNFIDTEGPVTAEQIMNKFSLSKLQLEKTFATLRHCELVHGFKENDKVFIAVWEKGGPGEMNIGD
jgi:hypothetical protein